MANYIKRITNSIDNFILTLHVPFTKIRTGNQDIIREAQARVRRLVSSGEPRKTGTHMHANSWIEQSSFIGPRQEYQNLIAAIRSAGLEHEPSYLRPLRDEES